MAHISAHQFQAVIARCCRNLQIGIGKCLPCLFQFSAELSIDASRLNIIGQHGYSWQDSLPDIAQMAVACRRAIGAFVQFADDNGTGELLFAGNLLEPRYIQRKRTRPQ